MYQSAVRIAISIFAVSAVGTGAVIYSRSPAPNERVEYSSKVLPAQPVEVSAVQYLDESLDADPEPEEAAVTGANARIDAGIRLVQRDSANSRPEKSSAAVDGASNIELSDDTAAIERLGVEIDAFLKTRQDAKDENPIPELVEWLNRRDEVASVAISDVSGEIYITFKSGGATVMQIGK